MKTQTLVFIFLLLLCNQGYSHHSYQQAFDNSREISLTGVITDVSWGNPHIEYTVETTTVIDGKQEIQIWKVPTAAPRVAQSNNLDSDSIKNGDQVTFKGWPARDGSEAMRALEVILEDGSSFRLRPDRESRKQGVRVLEKESDQGGSVI